MKLHRNRKKNNFKKFISLALACCMTLSMGSSYVSAGELGAGAAVQESREATESVPVQTANPDNRDAVNGAINMEETPSGEEQSQPSADAGQGSASDAEQQPTGDGSQQTQPSVDEDQDTADGTSNGGNQQTQPSTDEEQQPSADESKTPGSDSDSQAGTSDGENGDQGTDNSQTGASNSEGGEQDSDGSQPNQGGNINGGQGSNSSQDGTSTDGNPGDESPMPTSEPGADESEAEPGADGTGLESDADGLDEEFDGMEFGAELTEEEMMAIYEELVAFEELPEDEVGSVMYPDLGMNTFSMVRGQSWSFDIHYVNQNDSNNVTMTKDFNLKYQMEFHANTDFEEKEVIIRIPRALFTDRDGNTVNPNDIAVPKVESLDSTHIPSRSTPFNYYIEGDELVFFNYEKINSGTNAAWQVLYKNVKLMTAIDMTPWNLAATITAKVLDPANPTGKKTETKTPDPLTGHIESGVELSSVTKNTFRDTDRVYTPELYTQKQVGKYIEGGEDALSEEVKKNFDKYVYMVWLVTVSGKANQPWNLYIDDNPSVEDYTGATEDRPFIVGYKNYTNASYRLPLDTGKQLDGNEKVITDNRTEEWGTRFLVVTAYPKSMVYQDEKLMYNTLANNIQVKVEGKDGNDSAVKEASQKWNYREYDWEYTGELLYIEKKSDETISDPKHYTGWLKLYETAAKNGEGYGGIPFHTTGYLNSFGLTHRVEDSDKNADEYGSYIPGKAAELTTVDDFMYLRLNTEGIQRKDGKDAISSDYMLTRDDYYYTGVTVTQTDAGFDLWEADDSVPPESLSKYYILDDNGLVQGIKKEGSDPQPVTKTDGAYGETFNQDVYIYAIYAKDENGNLRTGKDTADDWELVWKEPWHDNGVMTYTFKPEEIAREPYRVKVVHKTINYRTTCNIDVEVLIRKGSQAEEIIEAYNSSVKDTANETVTEDTVLEMTMEDLSGVWGAEYSEGKFLQNYFDDGTVNYGTLNYNTPAYSKQDINLLSESNTLHENIKPYRDNANKLVTGLISKAYAYKHSDDVKSDVVNQRGRVNYYLTAYDGYKMYGRDAMNYLMSTEEGKQLAPGRSNVVFYDLLPYGMHFDYNADVVVGRLENLSGNYYQREDSYWTKNSEVKIDTDGEGIKVTENYRGTGRTMVAFHIVYTGKNSSVYTNDLWMEGWGVKFGAYFDWKNQAVIREGANVFAFMPDTTDPRYETFDLCGAPGQVGYDDGNNPGGISGADWKYYADLVKPDPDDENAKQGDIDGNPANDTNGRMNVLYARNLITDDFAVNAKSEIKKLVADSDNGIFGETAVVKPGATYLYEITVQTIDRLEDIVIFDRLENAKADNPNATMIEKTWKGTFDSVITTGLTQKGIKPVIYYQVGELGELAEITGALNGGTNNQTAAEYLAQAAVTTVSKGTKGWVTKEVYEKTAVENRPEVKAVAVYLVDANSKEGKSYTLNSNESVSLQIRMTAPDWENIKRRTGIADSTIEDAKLINFAYNEPYYYAVMTTEKTDETGKPLITTSRQTLPGNTVSVRANPYGSLEVYKEFDGTVPEIAANTGFRLRLYWEEGNKQTPAAGKLYTLYKKIVKDGKTQWVKQKEQLQETDSLGYFTLRAGEKAVFNDNLPDVKNIQIEEMTDMYWEEPVVKRDELSKQQDLTISGANSITVTNKYRPVLYVQKLLEGVPDGIDISGEEFTFQISVQGKDGVYHPLEGVKYYYVNMADTGAVIDTQLGENGEGETTKAAIGGNGAESVPGGTFRIKKGQTIAFFLGDIGTNYQLTELDSTGGKWICGEKDNTKFGTITQNLTTERITNYYRFKDIYLNKKLTHQNPSVCTQEFTFQVFTVDSANVEHPVTTGNRWELFQADENGRMILDGQGHPMPVLDENGNPIAGILSQGSAAGGLDATAAGKFTAACAGSIVKISGLELKPGTTDAIYVIREVETGDDYRAVNDTCEFVIHHTDKSVSGSITNDYLWRPLTVTKTVLYDHSQGQVTPTDREFYMKAEIAANGSAVYTPMAGKIYTLMKNGVEIPATAEDYNSWSQKSDQEKQKSFKVMQVEGNYYFATNEGGCFALKDGETAVFEKAGRTEDSFRVSEVQDPIYGQVSPSNGAPYEGTFSGESTDASIVNGQGDYLMLRKEYIGADSEGSAYIESVIKQKPEEYKVKLTLKVTYADGTSEIWPKADASLSVLDASGSMEGTNLIWRAGESVTIEPWKTVIVPLSMLNGVTAYTLTESAEDQHRIFELEEGKYIQISQKEPANDQGLRGKPESDRLAVISNEVKCIQPSGKTVRKWMESGSGDVQTGAGLVWKLEQYDGEKWIDAEGVEYLSFDSQGLTCSGVRKTDENGRIELEKTENGYPYVQFVTAAPYLNLYEPNTAIQKSVYRLVEMQKESGGWGRLAGYGTSDAEHRPTDDERSGRAEDGQNVNQYYNYSMNLSHEYADAFVNSNRMDTVEIEKQMADKTVPTESFAMILMQVVSGSQESGYSTIPGSYVPYKLYSSKNPGVPLEIEGKTEFDTGESGEILLKAGQYAKLELPENTQWLVSEREKDGYSLKDLTPDPGSGKYQKLDKNQMLIHPTMNIVPVKLLVEMNDLELYKGKWMVEKGAALTADSFTVKGHLSNGEIFNLTADDGNAQEGAETFQFSFQGDENLAGLTNEPGIKEMLITWRGMSARVKISVIEGEISLTKGMVTNGTDGSYTYYEADGRKTPLTGLNAGNVVIPEYVGRTDADGRYTECRITKIAADAYEGSGSKPNLDLISIEGKSIKEILDGGKIGTYTEGTRGAFGYCKNLVSVKFPNLLKAGIRAFYHCEKLTNVEMPDVTELGYETFRHCYALTKVEFLKLTKLGGITFSENYSLKVVNLPSLTSTWYDFQVCQSLETVNLPAVKTIGANTFLQWNNGKDMEIILDKTTRIEEGQNPAFNGCGKVTIRVIGGTEYLKQAMKDGKTWGAKSIEWIWIDDPATE